MLKTQWKTHFKKGGVQSGVFGCMKVFRDFVTQYCELQDETACNGKSADAAFRCVKNQFLTRSGRLCGDKTVFEHFGKIVVANLKKRTKRTFVSPQSHKITKTAKNRIFNGILGQNDRND